MALIRCQPFVFEFVSDKDKVRVTFTATVKKLVGIDVKGLTGAL
jgi:hypothetical protein